MTNVRSLPLTLIIADPDCQLRAAGSAATVDDYAEALREGAKFPPVTVFHDGKHYWLGDGFHRVDAHKLAGIDEIEADIREGDLRDAKLFAAGANAAHGLPRTQADKRNAITTLLNDEQWKEWSDKEIARRTGTSDKTVAKIRRELSGEGVNAEIRVERRFVTKHGTEATRTVSQQTAPNTGSMFEKVLRGLPDEALLAEVRRRNLVEGI
ncbi:MAG: ParB/RepB/Spo0J family partition protein [Oceanicaulis sp.]|nr:ParB/RepB/Spo0J family partition protein [Oceanicaulis sp.]